MSSILERRKRLLHKARILGSQSAIDTYIKSNQILDLADIRIIYKESMQQLLVALATKPHIMKKEKV